MPADRPHLLNITCHDLGRHLGCYGVPTVHTPNFDRLAAGGARFDQAFCTAPQCSPSRAALTTGRYPHSNGVMGLTHEGFDWDLGPDERPTPAILRDHGYQTHLFGLQHATPHVERLGFDAIHAPGASDGGALGAQTAAAVATEFEAVLETADTSRPLYLEINLFEPHRPYDHGGTRPDDGAGSWIPPYLPQSPEAREEIGALQGAVRVADEALGRVLAALDRRGIGDDSLTVFSADHGLAMPRAKCTLYDPGIGIALLVRWQGGGVAPGQAVGDLVSNIDVLPTLLEAAHIAVPERVQGRSLLGRLRGETSEQRTAIFAEKTFHSYYDPMRCIRTDRFKLIRSFETAFLVEVPGDVQRGAIFRADPGRYATDRRAAVELYDLADDPGEERNLAGAPQLAEVEATLDAQLWGWMWDTDDPLLRGPVPSPRYARALAGDRLRTAR